MNREYIIRIVLTIALTLGIITIWKTYFSPPPPPPPAAVTAPGTPAGSPATPAVAVPGAAPGAVPGAPAAATTAGGLKILSAPPQGAEATRRQVLGSSAYRGNFAMAVEVTPHGAAIRQVEMSDYFSSAADNKKAPDERRKFHIIQATEGAPSFVITRLDLVDADGATRIVEADAAGMQLKDAWWTPEEVPLNPAVAAAERGPAARFKLEITRDDKPFLTLRKTFRLRPRNITKGGAWFADPQSYGIVMDLSAEDRGGKLASVAFTVRGPEGLVREEATADGRVAIGGYADPEKKPELKTGADAGNTEVAKRKFTGALEWGGVIDKYFAVIDCMDPADPFTRFEQGTTYPAYPGVKGMTVPGLLLASHQKKFDPASRTVALSYTIFAGPKDRDLLEQAPFGPLGLPKVIQWSTGCCFIPVPGLESLAKFMVWAIDKLALVVVNKGVAIIILVILMRLLLLPLTRFNMISMLKMQDLGPEIAKLKEEHKDDSKAMQVAQMKLMRERGVNPLLGCLPMALQMPFWIALYTGIAVSISLRQEPFALWVKDLSQPDTLAQIQPIATWGVHWIGEMVDWRINILPFLMAFGMYLQMKLTPTGMGANTPEAAAQQKMMMLLMPLMMPVILYNAPSALNLYILTSTVLAFFESKYFRWHFAEMKKRPPKPKVDKPKGVIGRWIDAKMDSMHQMVEAAKKSEPQWEGKDKRRDKGRDRKK